MARIVTRMNELMTNFHARCVPLVALVALGMTGCTSVLTSASLRDLVWGGEEHAAEAAASADDETEAQTDLTVAEQGAEGSDAGPDATVTAEAQRREAAVEEASARLAKLGHLDDAARSALVETLERTDQEDWPAVIAAFAESLADTEAVPAAADLVAGTRESVDAHVVAKADLDAVAASDDAEPVSPAPPLVVEAAPAAVDVPPAPAEPAAPAPAAGVVVVSDTEAEAVAEAAPVPPFAVQNACFASRVQAWGVVDRFAADRFHPGQEVIVYFELDGLTAGESPAGHTTCIDTALRLVGADGRELHAWSFEPIAETCRARRHDYFVRYVVRLPADAATGPCRIECNVTDTLSGQVAKVALPLEIQPAAPAP